MRKRVSISGRTVIFALVFIIAAGLAALTYIEWSSYKHAHSIFNISNEALQEVTYVQCDITEYLVRRDSESYTGVGDVNEGLIDFYSYAIPLYDGTYVQTDIYDREILKSMEGFHLNTSKGNCANIPDYMEPVIYVGRVIPKKENTKNWMDLVETIDPVNVNTEFTIVQMNGTLIWNLFLMCAFIAIGAILGFSRSFVVRYEGDGSQEAHLRAVNGIKGNGGEPKKGKKKPRRDTVNLDYELKLAERRIEKLREEEARLRAWIFIGIAIVIVGAMLIVFMRKNLLVAGIALAILGLWQIWRVFYNSGAKLAVSLSEIFMSNTLYRRIKRAEAFKAEIESEIYEKNNPTKEKHDDARFEDAVMIDCSKFFNEFMIKIQNNTNYCIRDGEEDRLLRVNAEAEDRREQYLRWCDTDRDISGAVAYAPREAYFIRLDEICALWLVEIDPADGVSAISAFRLDDNGNISAENFEFGIDNPKGGELIPSRLRLRRRIECIGNVSAVAEYRLNSLAKPELLEDKEKHYYVDDYYADEIFVLQSTGSIRTWIVPEKEKEIDRQMAGYPVEEVAPLTKFKRLRIPKRAAHSYADFLLEDGRIMRVVQTHRFNETESFYELVDATGKAFEFYTYEAWAEEERKMAAQAKAQSMAAQAASVAVASNKSSANVQVDEENVEVVLGEYDHSKAGVYE